MLPTMILGSCRFRGNAVEHMYNCMAFKVIGPIITDPATWNNED